MAKLFLSSFFLASDYLSLKLGNVHVELTRNKDWADIYKISSPLCVTAISFSAVFYIKFNNIILCFLETNAKTSWLVCLIHEIRAPMNFFEKQLFSLMFYNAFILKLIYKNIWAKAEQTRVL